MFDAFAMVDWSAANVPRTGRDSIWICWHDSTGERLVNPGTRHQARALLADWLTEPLARGERVLIGFDFPFGYPAGFAARLGLTGPPWQAVWDEIARLVTDDEHNSNISKLARMLWEGMGFGWAEIAFSGVAHPRVDAALTRAARLGFRRIIVFPYFLFTGVLVKRIYAQTDAVARLFPGIEFVKALYLRDHPEVLDAFSDRVGEVREGQPAMNCQLCKYRTQIIGYESDAGAPQAAHHHHVRGVGTDGDHRHHHHR